MLFILDLRDQGYLYLSIRDTAEIEAIELGLVYKKILITSAALLRPKRRRISRGIPGIEPQAGLWPEMTKAHPRLASSI